MTVQNLKNFIFCLIFLTFILSPVLVFAKLEIQYPSIPFGGIQTPNEFMESNPENALPLYLNYFYHLALMIAGLVTFGSIVFGGFLYLTSFDSTTKMIAAKEQIFGAFMGLIILLSSYMILLAIDPNLLIFDISGLEEKTKLFDVPEIDFGKNVYFEIPIGMVIENAILDDLYLQKMNITKQVANQVNQASQKLNELTNKLKQETDKCHCGTTIGCSLANNCKGTGCSGAQCDKTKIAEISKEIEVAIENLKEKQAEILLAKDPLIDDFSQIEAASFLMSIENDEIFNYNYLLSIEGDYEIETFPGWEDLYFRKNDELIKDPLTFYLDKEKGKNSIYLASVWRWGTYSPFGVPEPLGGWPDPPESIPGKLIWPVESKRITSGYGMRLHPIKKTWSMHHGIDIDSNIEGYPVWAASDGIVIRTLWAGTGGNAVLIAHPELNITTGYLHLMTRHDAYVKPGDTVKAGDIIGRVGNTGVGTGAHLHFEIRVGTSHAFWNSPSVNPLTWLP